MRNLESENKASVFIGIWIVPLLIPLYKGTTLTGPEGGKADIAKPLKSLGSGGNGDRTALPWQRVPGGLRGVDRPGLMGGAWLRNRSEDRKRACGLNRTRESVPTPRCRGPYGYVYFPSLGPTLDPSTVPAVLEAFKSRPDSAGRR
jgi:hypothetical protein